MKMKLNSVDVLQMAKALKCGWLDTDRIASFKRLARLFDKGYLKETETGYQVLERRGKKFTRVEMTFRIDIKGVNLPDEYQQG